MRDEIISRLQHCLREEGLDAAICLSPENFAWVSGFVVPSHSLMRSRHAAVIVPASGKPLFFTVDMEESTVNARVPGATVRSWNEFDDRPMAVLADTLIEMGLSAARIGTELDYLSAADFAELGHLLPNARLTAFERRLAKLRQIKTVDEVALMRRLARIADQAILNAIADVGPGSTEMDIAGALTRNVYALGAEHFKLLIVATGERSVYPNVGPTLRKLRAGDICRVEIFAMIDGYHAGVCRTARVGKSPPHADDIWKTLIECKYLLLDMIRPGVAASEVYKAFIKPLQARNLPPIAFVGHGIGLHLHEHPYLRMRSDAVLEEGMVLGFEPLVYDTGYGFGMQNKDMLAVTDSGAELLSDVADTDRLLTIA